MKGKIFGIVFSILLLTSIAAAQKTEVTVSFNEQFFDALLDALFNNLKQPDFPLAKNSSRFKVQGSKSVGQSFNSADEKQRVESKNQKPFCDEVIRLQREMNGVRTAVQFRDGKIYAPIAFSGSYSPPLIGCVDFQGYAETNIDLEFDQQQQSLVGRVRVLNVQLGGVANLAGGFISRFVQSSIDRNVNPIEILRADKLAFIIPVQNSDGSLKLKATNLRHEVGNGVLNVHVDFEFQKAN